METGAPAAKRRGKARAWMEKRGRRGGENEGDKIQTIPKKGIKRRSVTTNLGEKWTRGETDRERGKVMGHY